VIFGSGLEDKEHTSYFFAYVIRRKSFLGHNNQYRENIQSSYRDYLRVCMDAETYRVWIDVHAWIRANGHFKAHAFGEMFKDKMLRR
jgi:hypothetical protein